MDNMSVQLNIRNDHIAVLTLNTPPLNLISNSTLHSLSDFLDSIKKNKAVRVVILTGSGNRSFSSGANLQEFKYNLGDGVERSEYRHALYEEIEAMPQPFLGALNGHAFGGGLELALACDFRLAVEGAKLGLTEINLGLFPAGGGCQRLPRVIGEVKAKEMILLGQTVSASEAFKMGLVNKVVARGHFVEETFEFAKRLAEKPTLALHAAKRAILAGIVDGKTRGYKTEALLLEEVMQSPDAKEGISAFLEKRKPNFQ